MDKEQTIQHYMRSLDISREEAEQLWQDEQDDNLPELTTEQKAVVKEMTQADRKKETTKRKRERKPDADKREIISVLDDALCDLVDDVTVTNPEREIEFIYNDIKYRLTLMKPRKEKA